MLYLLYVSNAVGEFERPTVCDTFLISRLHLLSQQYRDTENDQVMIEYFGSMKTSEIKGLDFKGQYDVSARYVIHKSQTVKDLRCHTPKDFKPNTPKTFNNYVLLSHYPTKNEIDFLDKLAIYCAKDLPKQFLNYVVAYLGPPASKQGAVIIARRMILMRVKMCSNPPTNVNEGNLKKIDSFVTKFQVSFESYQKQHTSASQFAVLYYGADITQAKAPENLFEKDRVDEGEGWIASLPEDKKKNPKHSEFIITHSIKCDQTRGHDIYLYTNFSPCTKCAKEIMKFAVACSRYYRSFHVFYGYRWRDCLESSYDITHHPAYNQVKMKFFQLAFGVAEKYNKALNKEL